MHLFGLVHTDKNKRYLAGSEKYILQNFSRNLNVNLTEASNALYLCGTATILFKPHSGIR